MLKYPCLVLDHDDTVVQTDKTLGYPFFCKILEEFRPGKTISLADYVSDCHNYGFAEMCRRRWQFTEAEQKDEYRRWMDYIKVHIPDAYPGIENVIRRQKENGGLVCVISHSSIENISRDYDTHFGIQPDAIYGWDLPKDQRKPSSWALEDMMRRYDLQPKDILVVDDMKLGWMMAQSLGVEIAFAAWSKADFPELETEMRSICDYTFDSPNTLEMFLFEE
ncbi:MAG: HAD family hydrolase [Oscillospiraceae bacterium]|nr:HAD family hydrolase [Oscillospiraceae bacterium]